MKRGSGRGDPALGLRKAWRSTQWKALLQRRAWTVRQLPRPHGEHGEPGQPQWPQEGCRAFFQVQWRAAERFQAARTGSDGYFKEIAFVCVCLVAQSCPTLCDPMDCSPPGSSVHGREYWSRLSFPPPRDPPNLGIKPVPLCFLHCQADSLPLNLPVPGAKLMTQISNQFIGPEHMSPEL